MYTVFDILLTIAEGNSQLFASSSIVLAYLLYIDTSWMSGR